MSVHVYRSDDEDEHCGALYPELALLPKRRGRDQTSKVLQQLQFAQSSLCENLLGEYIGDLLDGYALPVCCIGRSTVGPLATTATAMATTTTTYQTIP